MVEISDKKSEVLVNFLVVLIVFSTFFFFTFDAFAVDSSIDHVRIAVPTACTLSGSGDNTHNSSIVSGLYDDDIGTTTLKAVCNDDNGFSIYAIGYTNEEYGNTNLIGSSTGQTIITGTATGAVGGNDISNWAMKLGTVSSPSPTYPIIIAGSTGDTNRLSGDPDFSNYTVVPSRYAKVAYRTSGTDVDSFNYTAEGSLLTTTYAVYISNTQINDSYQGKVKYTLVHPASEQPLAPQPSTPGYINYYANASATEGTMGRQSASDGATVQLFASNYSRDGYGFAGWSDAYDYATNPNANFYGPNEDITVPAGTTANGLALYAVWVKSAGNLQDTTKIAELCGTGTGSLTAAVYNNEGDSDEETWSITAGLSSISALTDTRDGQTYAIAKLTDGKCWMIENLRLDSTHMEGNTAVPTTLTVNNTNNPLNDGNSTNPTVTIKHNYSDTTTYTNLSPSSNVAYDATTHPEGWCIDDTAECANQSRLRTDNTTNRATYTETTNMTSHNVNLFLYGNYYNWYSATAGNGTFDTTSGRAAGDICPYGWHLPTGTSTGEYASFSNSLGGRKNNYNEALQMNSSTTPTQTIMIERLRHFPSNFVYPGTASQANINERSVYGCYWTANANSIYAYGLDFYFVAANPGTVNLGRYNGRSVRCTATISN